VLFTVNVIHGRTQYDDSLVNSLCHEIQVQIENKRAIAIKKGDHMQCIKDA
jgi:hypothetical protein